MRSCGRGRGGCWPPRWKTRSPPTSPRTPPSGTRTGRRLVVRNGHARPRQVTTAAGAVEVTAPRVNDKRTDPATGERMRFSSAILPPWCRKSPKVTEVLPLLYLHGLSSKDFVPALEQFLGSGAGLSASAITRLTEAWQEEYRRWCERDLSGADYVYVLGGRPALQRPARCRPGLHPGGGRGPRRREEGAGRPRRRAPRVRRVLGRAAARLPGGGACAPRCWRSATGRWGSGPRCARCSPRPGRAAAGCTSWSTSWTACRNRPSPRPARPWRRSATPRTVSTPRRRSGTSPPPTAPSTPRRSPRSPTTRSSCWPSTTSRPSTGCI